MKRKEIDTRIVEQAGEDYLASPLSNIVIPEPVSKPAFSPLDSNGNWTKSTFDVLISALKQGRSAARE